MPLLHLTEVQPPWSQEHDTEILHCRALVTKPASVAGTATGDATRVARSSPRRAPDFFPTYAQIRARKPSDKVRLNAYKTSNKRVSSLEMSRRRDELITITLSNTGIARAVSYLSLIHI